MAVNRWDIRLRHAAVGGGAWLEFALAFTGRAGFTGLYPEPRKFVPVWVLNPSDPDPAAGAWGADEWEVRLLCADGLVGNDGQEFSTTGYTMVGYLREFRALPVFEFEDIDGVVHGVVITSYEETAREPWDASNESGAWVVTMKLTATVVISP